MISSVIRWGSFVFCSGLLCSCSRYEAAPEDDSTSGGAAGSSAGAGAGGSATVSPTGGAAGAPSGGAGSGSGGASAAGAAGSAGATSGGAGYGGGSPGPVACPDVSQGTVGVWEDVTPDGLSLDPADHGGGNFGVLQLVADPIRSCELYAFTNYQGVWKSNDYGTNWSKITTPGVMENGRAWGVGFDTNPERDPQTPLTLYACQGYGDTGMMKSTDGGVSWAQLFEGANVTTPINGFGAQRPDLYSIDVDPNDGQHLLATFHGSWTGSDAGGLIESTDGGESFALHYPPSGMGISHFVFFVTSQTWLVIAQDTAGVWRTTTAGRIDGQPNPAAWTKVGNFGHAHGSAQLFNAGDGELYLGGDEGFPNYGVFRSLNDGEDWTRVMTDASANAVFATSKYIYSDFGWANSGGVDQTGRLRRAPRDDGDSWTDYYPTPPAGLTNGSNRAAVAFDGTHNIIVSGMWNAGIWRYVEP